MKTYSYPILVVLLAGLAAPASRADFVNLTSSQDNTLVQVQSSSSPQLSNGSGPGLFVGETNQNAGTADRRGLLQFDLSSIPAGSIINSATLTLRLTIGNSNAAETISLHTVLAPWGEGASSTGGGAGAPAQSPDATWFYSKYNSSLWTTPGGDFTAASSASLAFAPGQSLGAYTWSGGTLASDVQAWVDGTMSNDGWLLLGNESQNGSARAFGTRESATPPELSIDYTPPSTVPGPPSILLLATGMVGLALRGRRRRYREGILGSALA